MAARASKSRPDAGHRHLRAPRLQPARRARVPGPPQRAHAPGRPVPEPRARRRTRRSLLFAPASRPDVLAQAAPQRRPTAVALDLEDAVPPDGKPAPASTPATSAPSSPPSTRSSAVYVRVNPVPTEWFDDDLADGVAPSITGVIVPKLETPEQLADVADALARPRARRTCTCSPGSRPSLGVEQVRELLVPPVARRLLRRRGLRRRHGRCPHRSGTPRCSTPGRASRWRPGSRASPRSTRSSPGSTTRTTSSPTPPQGRALGYRGKLCIHPAQVAARQPRVLAVGRGGRPGPAARRRVRRGLGPRRGRHRVRGPDGRRAPRPPRPRRDRRRRRRPMQPPRLRGLPADAHPRPARRRPRTRASARSRSSSPRRGGSRTPARRPRPRAPHRRRARPTRVARRPAAVRRSCAPPATARRSPTPTRSSPASSTLLHDAFVPHQVPADLRRAIVELETRVESTFNKFRGTDRRPAGRRQRDRRDPAHQRRHRRARRPRGRPSKQIGPEVADRVRELARLRNQAARDARRSATTSRSRSPPSELDEERLFATLDDVDRATAAPFAEWKHDARRPAWPRGSAARRRRCAPGTSTTRSSRAHPPTAPSTSTTSSPTPTSKRSPSAPTTASASTCGRCSTAATSTRGRARASTRSASTSTATATCACSATSSPASAGWTRCSTSSATPSTTASATPTLPWLLRGAAHALTTEGVAMLMGRLPRDPGVAAATSPRSTPTPSTRSRPASPTRSGPRCSCSPAGCS